MRTAQLNAISRSYTRKAQERAIRDLLEQGIQFEAYCKAIGYKGSPVALCTAIANGSKKTLANVEAFKAKGAK